MKSRALGMPCLSILGGFLGAFMFHVFLVGVSVEAEESPRTVVADSISVKQLTLFNDKNEAVATLETDSYGLPRFSLGRNDLNRIDFNFVTENQPVIKVMGGMGKSYSVMSVRNQGPYWEPMIGLGHRDKEEGVMMSIFKGAGNLIITDNQGQMLRFDPDQGKAWRKTVFRPSSDPSIQRIAPVPSVPYSNISNR